MRSARSSSSPGQAAATSGGEQARYQAASDKWALRNRAELDGDRDSAAQLMASTVAGFANAAPAPNVLRAGADQCVAAAPA